MAIMAFCEKVCFSNFFVYFIANNGIMAMMVFGEKNIPLCKSLQIIRYWYTFAYFYSSFAYFYSSWGPRVAQGCPKGAPRAPQDPILPTPRPPKAPLWSPRVPQMGAQGTLLEPQGHQKAPQELNFVSLWHPWAYFCARGFILSTSRFKYGLQGLIFIDVANVTRCFHGLCCKGDNHR